MQNKKKKERKAFAQYKWKFSFDDLMLGRPEKA
jgi:hypothetical protein